MCKYPIIHVKAVSIAFNIGALFNSKFLKLWPGPLSEGFETGTKTGTGTGTGAGLLFDEASAITKLFPEELPFAFHTLIASQVEK